MIAGRRLRSIGWVALIGVCFSLLMILSFRVNALKSEVRLAEKRIVAVKREQLYLETEFETRASQQQLKVWNDVDFGYVAPNSRQYLENERQLAALGKPAGPDAPRPIRVASADDSVVAAAAFPAMVSPLTGKAFGEDKTEDDEEPKRQNLSHETEMARLGERLATVERLAKAKRDTGKADAPARSAAKPDKKSAATAPKARKEAGR
jgi:hypothetical protein